jgi:hypothetical protein
MINTLKKNYKSLISSPIFAFTHMRRQILFSLLSSLSLYSQAQTQTQSISSKDLAGQLNTVTTMVPFLTITPDSRSAGMGDVGVALFSPDANSGCWNNANLLNAEKSSGFSISYAPWLRQLVDDVGFSYLSGYQKVGKRGVISGSFRYFSLGNIQFTDFEGAPQGSFNPNEFAFDAGYALGFTKQLSMGVNLRYIYSNIVGSGIRNGIDYNAATSIAGDISLLYKTEMRISGKKRKFNLGMNIQNIGSKMTYSSKEKLDFIPTNLKLGVGYNTEIDNYNKVNVYLDFNKLLVPTRPYYLQKWDNSGDSFKGNMRQYVGTDPNVGTIQGMFQSFTDAPGGFTEEMKEWITNVGVEYIYDNAFSVRGGLFYESATKGGRQYITTGIGLKFQSLTVDAAYLIPLANRHPLQNQMRFSLLFDLNSLKETPPTTN